MPANGSQKGNDMAALVCKVMGVVLVVAAAWGFITGAHLPMFHVDRGHNVIHLLSGIGALACGFAGRRPARVFSPAFGVIYGFLAVRGIYLGNFVVDHWLQVAMALGFIVVGLVSGPGGAPVPPATAAGAPRP